MEMGIAQKIRRYTYHPRAAVNGMAKSWHIIYSNDGINYASADNKADQTLIFNTPVTYSITPVKAKYWGICIYKAGDSGYTVTQELTFHTV